MIATVGKKIRRLRRLLRRAAEAPMGFVMWKICERVGRLWWAWFYVARARFGEFGSGTAAKYANFAEDPAVFRRDYSDFARVPWSKNHREWVTSTASMAQRGKIRVLGFDVLDFGTPIRWSEDPFHAVSWPEVAGMRIQLVPRDLYGDIKIPWELNRLQFLVNLAQAWVLTGDGAHERAWRAVIEDWPVKNRQGIGVAWSCTMEAAIRAVNIATSSAMMWPTLSRGTRQRVMLILDEHRTFIRRHPERSDVSGNHYFVGTAVLLQLDLLLGQGIQRRMVRSSAAKFFAEVRSQFTAGGLHFEFSTNYHRFMTEILLLTLAECDRWSFPVPADVLVTASRAAQNCVLIAGAGSTVLPLIGDSDSGQALSPDSRASNDIRLVQELANFVLCATAPDAQISPAAAWAVGSGDRKARTSPTREESIARRVDFPVARVVDGFGVVTTYSMHLVLRSGKPGLEGRGGHEHSDIASPVVSIGQRPVIVDPGTWQYTYSRGERSRELGARAHNMVVVDGQDPLPVIEGSVMPTVSNDTTGTLSLVPDQRSISLHASHDGFRHLAGVLSYERICEVGLRSTSLIIRDRLTGQGSHNVQMFWHLHPGIRIVPTERMSFHLEDRLSGQAIAELHFDGTWGSVAVETYRWSPEYGQQDEATLFRLKGDFTLPCQIETHLAGVSQEGLQ